MTSEQIKRLLLPERYQIVICFLLSAILIGISLGSLIYDKFLGESILNTPEARSIYLESLGRLSDIPAVRTAVIVFFWGGVGLAAYVFYLGISNALTEARNEVVIETAYTNRGPFLKVITRIFPQLLAAAALLLFLYVTARLLLPIFLEWTALGIVAWPQITGAAQLLGGLIAIAVSTYVAWTLGQLMFALE